MNVLILGSDGQLGHELSKNLLNCNVIPCNRAVVNLEDNDSIEKAINKYMFPSLDPQRCPSPLGSATFQSAGLPIWKEEKLSPIPKHIARSHEPIDDTCPNAVRATRPCISEGFHDARRSCDCFATTVDRRSGGAAQLVSSRRTLLATQMLCILSCEQAQADFVPSPPSVHWPQCVKGTSQATHRKKNEDVPGRSLLNDFGGRSQPFQRLALLALTRA